MIADAFNEIEALDLPRCSPEHLAAMRSIVFRYAPVHDAAYRIDDKWLCSSGLGVIEAPEQALGQPTFVAEDGMKIWLRVKLSVAPGVIATVLKKGDLSLMIAPGQHPTQTRFGTPLSAIFVNAHTGQVLTFQGPKVDYPAAWLRDGAEFRDGLRRVSVACVVTRVLCYVQVVTPGEILHAELVPFSLLVALGTCIGALGGLSHALLKLRRATWPYRIRAAIAAGHISLEYQPILELASGRITGAEALMRWTQPDGTLVPPAEFIPAAETSSLITDLDCLAVEIVLRDFGDLLRRRPDLSISINIVARDLTDPRFFAVLDQGIAAAGVAPHSLGFELTERQPIVSDDAFTGLKRLHRAGHRIYLDDFGMGYSNIAHLDRFDVDAIKLDKLFTQALGTDPALSRLTRTILDMAADLGTPIIAEGVETEAQVKAIQAAGVRFAQGWLFSRAVPASELIRLAEEREPALARLPSRASVVVEDRATAIDDEALAGDEVGVA